jgi:hypothetical protein
VSPNIITSSAKIATATTADILATFNKLSKKKVERFATRAIGERRLRELMEEREAAELAEEQEEAAQQTQSEEAVAPAPQPKPAAKIASRIMQKIEALRNKAITLEKERPNRAERAKPVRATNKLIVPTFDGRSKPQAASQRRKVLEAIQSEPKGLRLESLNTLLGFDARGYIQKLAEMGHLRLEEIAPEAAE